MSIIEAQSILTGWFVKHDSINNEQFISIAPKKTLPNEAEAAFSFALQEFENKGIVGKFIGVNDKGNSLFTWCLRRPLILNSQTLVINGQTALSISNCVNSFYESMGDKENFCNPLEICQNDIDILLEITSLLSEQNLEKNNNKENIKTNN
jgi:hypothetical protein